MDKQKLVDKEYGVKIKFIKVDSHTDKKGKGQYLLGSEEYPHAVYNDIVDTLAKAETRENPIGCAENFNMVRVMPDEFKTFKEVEAEAVASQREQARRMHARNLFEVAVSDKRICPIFRN